jgi:hypothetical protein
VRRSAVVVELGAVDSRHCTFETLSTGSMHALPPWNVRLPVPAGPHRRPHRPACNGSRSGFGSILPVCSFRGDLGPEASRHGLPRASTNSGHYQIQLQHQAARCLGTPGNDVPRHEKTGHSRIRTCCVPSGSKHRQLGVSSIGVGSEVCGGVPWGDAGYCRVETRPCAPVRSRNAGLNRDDEAWPPSPTLQTPSARLPPPVAAWPPQESAVRR